MNTDELFGNIKLTKVIFENMNKIEQEVILDIVEKTITQHPITLDSIISIIELSGELSDYGYSAETILENSRVNTRFSDIYLSNKEKNMEYKEFVTGVDTLPEVLPKGSQIYIVDDGNFGSYEFKRGWSDYDAFGDKIGGIQSKRLELRVTKIRIPCVPQTAENTDLEWYEDYRENGGEFEIGENKGCYYKKDFYISRWNEYLWNDGKLHYFMNKENYYKTKEDAIKFLRKYLTGKDTQIQKPIIDSWKDFVNDTIENRVANNESFTAYDISKQVQQEMKEDGLDHVRHLTMRDFIHEELKGVIGYERILEDFGSYSAYQYRPNQARVNFTNALQDYNDENDHLMIKSHLQTKTYTRYVDRRGSITIPKELVRELGWKNGQAIYTVKDVDGVHLTPQKQTQTKSKYTVYKGQVRPTKKVLGKKNSFTVKRSGNEVVIV